LQSAGEGGRTDLLGADGKGEPEPLLKTTCQESGAHFSPDGRFFAYESDETGKIEVFVATIPAGGGKWQISAGGSAQPTWGRNGRELFFRTNEGVTACAWRRESCRNCPTSAAGADCEARCRNFPCVRRRRDRRQS
jgi:Tol biopolymer transport system component